MWEEWIPFQCFTLTLKVTLICLDGGEAGSHFLDQWLPHFLISQARNFFLFFFLKAGWGGWRKKTEEE